MSSELFAIIDFEDGSRDVSISVIVEPRKEYNQYKVGDMVVARCPGFPGKHNGEIAAIHRDRSLLKKYVQGPRPVCLESDAVVLKKEPPEDTSLDKAVQEKGTNKNNDSHGRKRLLDIEEADMSEQVAQKRVREVDGSSNQPKGTDEAKDVKKKESLKKKEQIQECELANARQSQEILEENRILKEVQSLVKQLQDIRSEQEKMNEKLDSLTEIANCSKCLRAKYMLTQKSSNSYIQPTLHRFANHGNLITSKSPSPVLPQAMTPMKSSPPTSTNPPTPTGPPIPTPCLAQHPTAAATAMSTSVENAPESVLIDYETHSGKTAKEESNQEQHSAGLVFFGEAKYSVLVEEQDLLRVRECSKNAIKFALNALELIISADECRDSLTVYGIGKGKKAMDKNKRKALRGEIFSFMKNSTQDEKEKLWMDTIVPKLNNKIRGIRNNKYKTN